VQLIIEERESDSPFVERVWRSRSEDISTFTSIAANHFEFVVTKYQGNIMVTLRGPETQATVATPVLSDAEFFGILFKLGTFMPHMPIANLVNGDAQLPDASSSSFWLKSSAWQLPDYDNAETFVERLVREGLLVQESLVKDVLQGRQPYMSLRSVQRHFLRATGLTLRTMQQTERARQAALMLQDGRTILDTVHELGYFDQAHLTKSLKHFIGHTPTQLMDTDSPEQLSLLYKTSSPD
jgi:hypothetical protein